MLVNIFGAKCIGIDAFKVIVEVDITMGIGIHLCGLADVAVKESLLRTVTALQSLGYHIPGKKIVINLAPANLQKNGSGYDLPIAVGIIAASEQRNMPRIHETLVMGELGLDGSVRDICGGLPIADFAKKEGLKVCILPYNSALEAKEMEGIRIYGVKHLSEAVSILEGSPEAEAYLIVDEAETKSEEQAQAPTDFSEIIGQQGAKRAMEIAAAGGHNIILMGAPGSGKSSLAKAMAGILPPLSKDESFMCRKIYSIAGKKFTSSSQLQGRPFRSPHYSASMAAILGGGGKDNIIPGEVTLAHLGVLFLDEFNLMPKSTTEALRAPLEDRKITISRLKYKVEYPASFTLVAAANPCACGYYGEGDRCTCSPAQRRQYLSRLSGPIMDRMDLQVWVHPLSAAQLRDAKPSEPSSAIAARVLKAREIQSERLKGTGLSCNAEMDRKAIDRFCILGESESKAMTQLMEAMGFSMRAYYRIIKVARTIADLEDSAQIENRHLMEAAGYRFLDKRDLL